MAWSSQTSVRCQVSKTSPRLLFVNWNDCRISRGYVSVPELVQLNFATLYWSRSTTGRSGITQRLVAADLIADILYFRDLAFGQIYDAGFGKTQIILTGNVIWLLPGKRYSPKFRARSCKIFLSVYRTEFGGKPYVLAANANQTGESSVVSPSISLTSSFLPLFLSFRRHTEALKDFAMALKTRLNSKYQSKGSIYLLLF